MSAVTASTMAAGSWAIVAMVVPVLLFLAFAIWQVRSAKTNMVVRIGKIIEIHRGKPDPPTPVAGSEPRTQLRTVGESEQGTEPSARSG
jgi:hypothetical protein